MTTDFVIRGGIPEALDCLWQFFERRNECLCLACHSNAFVSTDQGLKMTLLFSNIRLNVHVSMSAGVISDTGDNIGHSLLVVEALVSFSAKSTGVISNTDGNIGRS